MWSPPLFFQLAGDICLDLVLDQSMETLWLQSFKPRSELAKPAERTQAGTTELHRQT